MLWSSIYEISLCIGFILIILYGLFSLSTPTLGMDSKTSGKVTGLNISNPRVFQDLSSIDRNEVSGDRIKPHQGVSQTRGFSTETKFLSIEDKSWKTRGFELTPFRDSTNHAHLVNLSINDVYFFSRLWPIMFLLGYAIDVPLNITTQVDNTWVDFLGGGLNPSALQSSLPPFWDSTIGCESQKGGLNWEFIYLGSYRYNNGIDLLLIFLTLIIMQSFRSFESNLLLLLAFVGQIFMLHSCDLVSFYICLELQNFCFLVLCGLQPRTLQFNQDLSSPSHFGVFADKSATSNFGVFADKSAISQNCVSWHNSVVHTNTQNGSAWHNSVMHTLVSDNYPTGGAYGSWKHPGKGQLSQTRGFSTETKFLESWPFFRTDAPTAFPGPVKENPLGFLKTGIVSLAGSRPLAGVEATIKYLLLSAFSSGVLLFWFSTLYLKTGITSLVPPLSPSLFGVIDEPLSATSNFQVFADGSATSNFGVFADKSAIPQNGVSWHNSVMHTIPENCVSWQYSVLHTIAEKGSQTLGVFDRNGVSGAEGMPKLLILIALMFKLGGAPLHLWMIDIYGGVKRQLLMYISTAPKLSFFGFWISTWHSVWTDFSLLIFVAFSMIIGCFGAYSQPTLRSLFAYSTVNEIGLMLMAIETAGFHSLFQHLTIYIITMLLLWNNSDKRFFAILAVSLAGLPPLAGFFGKAWVFNSVATGSFAGPYIGILIISLFCTGLSLVYYLRVFRLFFIAPFLGTRNPWLSTQKGGGSTFFNNIIIPAGVDSNTGVMHNMGIETRTYGYNALSPSGALGAALFFPKVKLTSFCVVFLIFAPLFYIKPFVL